MDSYEKDYRYLLLNLIPQHRLPPVLRRDVEAALASGVQKELRRQSMLALEELCKTDYFERIRLRRAKNNVVADYKRKGGRYSVSVSFPSEEWTEYGKPLREDPLGEVTQEEEQPPVQPHEERIVETPRRAPEENVDTLGFIPDITRVFSISARSDPIISRLDLLLRTLSQLLNVPGIRLLLLEEIVNMEDVSGDMLVTIPESTLRENDMYRMCIESGTKHTIKRSPAVEEYNRDAPDEWESVGISPVFGMGKVCGVLKIFFAAVDPETTKRQKLETASRIVRQALEFNSQIETITSVDALTQVYNRHFYDTQVAVEIERATRSGSEVSMLFIDLDDFKKVNDELGHKKGDEALSIVAEQIRKNLRKVDLPFRYGGEEFAILLPGTSEFESVHTAERLRRVVSEYTGFKDLHGATRTITVSIGVSVFPGTAKSGDELFEQADAAMYRAKELGKNAVVLYKDNMKMGQ